MKVPSDFLNNIKFIFCQITMAIAPVMDIWKEVYKVFTNIFDGIIVETIFLTKELSKYQLTNK